MTRAALMFNRERLEATRGRQHGATLVVGLVLLLVLTVVGVSGMSMATMEVAMAANTRFQQDAFQLAEDGIELVLGNRRFSTAADDPRNVVDWLGNADYDRQARAVYLGRDRNTPLPGSSMGVIEAFHFDITSVGRGPRGAQSTHRQSFYVPGRAAD